MREKEENVFLSYPAAEGPLIFLCLPGAQVLTSRQPYFIFNWIRTKINSLKVTSN